MRPLIETGRLFIAQPPLYKVKTKKLEQYLSSESGLREFLVENGLGSLEVADAEARGDARTWTGVELRLLADDLRRLEDVAEAPLPLWSRVDPEVLIRSWDGGELPEHWAQLEGRNHFFQTGRELRDFLELQKSLLREDLRIYTGPEGEVSRDGAHVLTSHVAKRAELADVLASLERQGLRFRGGGRFEVRSGKDTYVVDGVLGLARALRKGAQNEVDVQRYKGLGEMNPEQLWESTMDPARRLLYVVRLEDEVRADEIFTVLMSTGVESRREYIERHALEATNLDV
jgi:DNA gyrase subunit B